MSDVVERVTDVLEDYILLPEPSKLAAKHILSALRPGDVLPGGMVVVPPTLTLAMTGVFQRLWLQGSSLQERWSAMLAAAKEPDNAD